MKFYNCVIEKLETNNYKKGVTRHFDMKGGYYKTVNVLYIGSFIWYVIFAGLFLFANADFLFTHDIDLGNKKGLPILIAMISSFVAMVVGFLLIRFKLHFIGVPLNIAAAVTQMIMMYKDQEVANAYLNGFLNNKFFWFYYAPAILIILFSVLLLLFYIIDRIGFLKDYNRSMNSMLEDYKKENPAVSDIDWQQHLKELDAKMETPKKEKKRTK